MNLQLPDADLTGRISTNSRQANLWHERMSARAAASGGDPGEAAAGAVRLAMLPDDGPTGQAFSRDGSVAPW